jgi:hypothetical protein
MSQDHSFIGAGRAYLRKVGYAGPRIEVGNCSALTLAVKEGVKKLPDHTQGGGGNRNEVRRIESVECSITMHDLNPTNLARALLANTPTALSAGAATNQLLEAGYKGGFVPFPYPEDSSVAPVISATNGVDAATRANSTAYALGVYLVPATPNDYFYKVTTAGTSAASPPTFGTTVGGTTTDGTATLTCMGKVVLVADTDYEVVPGGIILDDAAAFTDGQDLEADFTKAAADRIHAITETAQEYELFIAIENEARSGKAVNVTVHRLKLGAVADLPLIGDDFAAMVQAGEILADSSQPSGESQYFFKDVVR